MTDCRQELCERWTGDGNVCACSLLGLEKPCPHGRLEDLCEDRQPDECGYSYDHSESIMYEDDETIQWVCTECGAEGWYDKEPE